MNFTPLQCNIGELGYGLDDHGSIPGRGSEGTFSPRRGVQTGSGAHPAFCPVGTASLNAGGKAAEA